jgi:hypothetical protein
MSFRAHPIGPVPAETARVALAAFLKGNLYMTLLPLTAWLRTEHEQEIVYPSGDHPLT